MTEIKDFERSQEHCYTARFAAQVVCVIITLERDRNQRFRSQLQVERGFARFSALPKCRRL